GEVIVHIMQPATRQYYNLEELWAPAKPRGTRARGAAPARKSAAHPKSQARA
ncbi:MAG TPA: RsfS/YbeB/iojap family protein, partial [Burkholderiales bacterium]